jgi:hypothetical protein
MENKKSALKEIKVIKLCLNRRNVEAASVLLVGGRRG